MYDITDVDDADAEYSAGEIARALLSGAFRPPCSACNLPVAV
jgi:hypothetical protein